MTSDVEPLIARLIKERDIQDLLANFDDAVIRYDRSAFRELWTTDGIWEISSPVPLRAQGQDAVLAALDQFHMTNQFFFRSTARPVMQIDGNHAQLRSPTIELARREGSLGYANVAVYADKVTFDGGV